jgi:carbonic anhydrase
MFKENGAKIPAKEALERLMQGNKIFREGKIHLLAESKEIPYLVSHGQHPYATVITCSDSRVPPEFIFDCGLGELFVIRTAGNVVSDFEVGSVEYAAAHLGTHLVVVMGHANCGAVGSTVEAHTNEGCLGTILSEIEPSVIKAKQTADPEHIVEEAENLNVMHAVEKLRANPVLQHVEGLMIVGAKYDTETGEVHLLEEK